MAKIQVQGIGVYDDKTLKKKIIDMANSLSKLAKKGEWSKSSENGIRALGRMWGAYQDWSRKNESVNEKIKNTETGFKWKQIPKSGTINFGKYGKYVILSKNNHRVSGKWVSGPQKGKKVTWYSREGQKDARKRKGKSISDTPAFPKTMVKEAMLNERITKAFMVHPTDPSQTERHWVDRFKELADGHGPIIDYGPRESDIYDWNDRRNYKKAIEEYNKYMGKIADGLNKQLNLMNNIWKVWRKISEKYRKIDKSKL